MHISYHLYGKEKRQLRTSKHLMMAYASYTVQLQKEVKSNPEQLICCSPKRATVKKDVKSRIAAKK